MNCIIGFVDSIYLTNSTSFNRFVFIKFDIDIKSVAADEGENDLKLTKQNRKSLRFNQITLIPNLVVVKEVMLMEKTTVVHSVCNCYQS